MKEVNPIKFTRNLFNTYKRYLYSFVSISDSELRDLYWKALDNRSYEYFKGPYIQCSPQYKTSLTLQELMNNTKPPFLDRKLISCNKEYFNPNRPLYTHQVKALEMIQKGKNVVIATGTGSGKTESFLLPLLHDAIQNPSSGVRAIIIYPMNALANDQLERMRELLKTVPEVTFGRYTGETPYTIEEVKKQNPDYRWNSNERYTREEIRENPPHILLTNFAMLEYLLLRPSDADIFSQKSVKYVVLDEAHTYTGAKGIDIAMLLRRFISQFPDNKIQFILTSATISKKHDEVADFASKLCGVPFDIDGVIFGEEETVIHPDSNYKLSIDDYKRIVPSEEALDEWYNSLSDPGKLYFLINNSSICSEPTEKDTSSRMLYNILNNNPYLAKIRKLCKEKPLTISTLAQKIFNSDNEEAKRIVAWLLVMGSYAKKDRNSLPLLPVKLHYFIRGLSGLRVCMDTQCKGNDKESLKTKWKALFLEERESCKYCNSKVLSVSACIHCGLPVFKVYVKDGKWQIIKPAGNTHNTHLLTIDFRKDDTEESEDESTNNGRIRQLCLKCGNFSEETSLLDCCDNPSLIHLIELNSDENGNLRECPQCKGTSGPFESFFREFKTGDDAPTSVIAEAILRELPEEKNDKPAEGRSLIAFSDSRQRAAFFATYLKRTTLETAFLQPLAITIKKAEQLNNYPSTIDEIATQYVAEVSQKPFFVTKITDTETGIESYDVISRKELTQSKKNKLKKDIMIELYRQICKSPRHRNSLTGLALAYPYIEFSEVEREKAIKHLSYFNHVSKNDIFSLLQVLLQVFLRRQSIKLPDGITSDMIGESRLSARFHRTKSDKFENRRLVRWNPFTAPQQHRKNAITKSVPLKILKKVFPEHEYDMQFYDDLLGKIWDLLIDSVLVDCGKGEYQLNFERILIGSETNWYKCNACGIITPYHLKNQCPLPECNGNIRSLTDKDIKNLFSNNHTHDRFTRKPMPIKVKEHTAQLTNETGREYQTEFKNGDINVLSTSTTFELGIDVGQLKSVFLRNIPPTTSSYIQRAGRAGRRIDGTSFVVTFARNVPHDQYFFNDVLKIIGGKISTPIINLKNTELIQRHINSYLLGKFLKAYFREISNRSLTLEWFFLGPEENFSPYLQFIKWIRENNDQLLVEVNNLYL